MSPHHRFVMGSPHYNAHLVCQFSVLRVVFVKGAVPHGRPQVVGLKAQQQLEQATIETAVEASESLFGPSAQAGPFVVQEDTTILHLGRRLHIASPHNADTVVSSNGNISPVIPGRNADLLGHIVNAVDGAALVAAGYHQTAINRLDEKRFPLSTDITDIYLSLADEVVDKAAFTNGTYHDAACRQVGSRSISRTDT